MKNAQIANVFFLTIATLWIVQIWVNFGYKPDIIEAELKVSPLYYYGVPIVILLNFLISLILIQMKNKAGLYLLLIGGILQISHELYLGQRHYFFLIYIFALIMVVVELFKSYAKDITEV